MANSGGISWLDFVNDRRSDIITAAGEGKKNVEVAILTNAPPPSYWQEVWKTSSLRICADGGANRLFDNPHVDSLPDPDFIIGDVDSCRKEVIEFYTRRGSKVVQMESQDVTDVEKCLISVLKQTTSPLETTIFLLGGVTGRLDHSMANLNLMIRYADKTNLILGTTESATKVLRPGRHSFRLGSGVTCAMLPLAGPTRVTTRGLRWDLDDTTMHMGGLISTSNLTDQEEVVILNDVPLFWSVVLKKDS